MTTDPLYSRPWTQRVGLLSRRVPISFFISPSLSSAPARRIYGFYGAVRSPRRDEAVNFSVATVPARRGEARRGSPVELTRTTGVKSRWRRPTSGRRSDRSNVREGDFQISVGARSDKSPWRTREDLLDDTRLARGNGERTFREDSRSRVWRTVHWYHHRRDQGWVRDAANFVTFGRAAAWRPSGQSREIGRAHV